MYKLWVFTVYILYMLNIVNIYNSNMFNNVKKFNFQFSLIL